MGDTHIHHYYGESAPAATKPASRPVKAKAKATRSKPKKKAGAYQKRYGKHFKRLAPGNKKKDGSWKKDGFKKTQKAAHRAAKK